MSWLLLILTDLHYLTAKHWKSCNLNSLLCKVLKISLLHESLNAWIFQSKFKSFSLISDYVIYNYKCLRSELFWDITQSAVVIPVRCFGTIFPSHLQLSIFLDPWNWDRYVAPNRQWEITTTRCVISKKSAVVIYFAAAAWNNAYIFFKVAPCINNIK